MTTARTARLDTAVEAGLEPAIAELKRLCRQPSVSATGQGIAEAADLVAETLRAHGVESRVIQTPGGHPVVYGEAAGDSERTLLCYNHYDVQPPEPLDLWETPPFEPTIRDGKLFARGVCDDKGHLVSRLAALDAIRAVRGSLPCRVKFVVEGEEEIGSPRLAPFVEANRELLRADGCLWEAGWLNEREQPVIYLGMRGILYVELSVRSISRDAHSGLGGSILPNAAWRLTWALASIKGPDGRVRIPGFSDDVVPPTSADLDLLARLPDEEPNYRREFGVERFLNDLTGLDLRRASVFEPTCTICGLTSGYQGPSTKTVLPAVASAKIDFRLVPRQDPEDICRKLRRHLDAAGFPDVEITMHSAEHPARVDPSDPFVGLAARTATEVHGREPAIWPIVGGSGPIHPFVEVLGVPVATPGIGYPGNRVHSPNENIRLADFVRGTKWTARIIDEFA